MTYNDNYLDITADVFSEMHVIIEGSIAIFENDTGPLIRLSTQSNELEARTALSDIGGALYTLRGQIQKLQAAVRAETERQHAMHREEVAHD